MSIIKEPKLLFEKTQLNDNKYFFILYKANCAVNSMGFYSIMVVDKFKKFIQA